MTNWQAGFILAAIALDVVLAFALLRLPERRANRPLAAVLLVLAGMLSVYPLGWHGHAEVPVWLAFLPVNLPLLLGPMLYFDAVAIARRGRPRAWAAHLAPGLAQFVYLVVLSSIAPASAGWWKEQYHDALVKPAVEAAVLVSLAVYAAASLAVLRRFRAALRASRSDADRHDERWLSRQLAAMLVALALLAAVRWYATFVAELDGAWYFLWFAAWSAWLGIGGWRVAGIAAPALAPIDEGADRRAPARDWGQAGAAWRDTTRAAGWSRDPGLSLAGLARRLGTNTLYLSRAINEGLGMNFNEMVNRLRSEAVARALRDGDDGGGDLLTLALDAGFSSKATFNRSFKAAFGVTPSDYRRRLGS